MQNGVSSSGQAHRVRKGGRRTRAHLPHDRVLHILFVCASESVEWWPLHTHTHTRGPAAVAALQEVDCSVCFHSAFLELRVGGGRSPNLILKLNQNWATASLRMSKHNPVPPHLWLLHVLHRSRTATHSSSSSNDGVTKGFNEDSYPCCPGHAIGGAHSADCAEAPAERNPLLLADEGSDTDTDTAVEVRRAAMHVLALLRRRLVAHRAARAGRWHRCLCCGGRNSDGIELGCIVYCRHGTSVCTCGCAWLEHAIQIQ
jgi:hypothetical protein